MPRCTPTRTEISKPKPLLYPFAQFRDFPGDVETRLHSAVHVVLVSERMAEHGEQAVALRREDVPFILVDDFRDVVAIAADHGEVDLGLDPGGQRSRVDDVGEHDCQPAELVASCRRGEKIFGFGVAAVDCQHLRRELLRGGGVAPVEGLNCPVEQFFDCGVTHPACSQVDDHRIFGGRTDTTVRYGADLPPIGAASEAWPNTQIWSCVAGGFSCGGSK